MFGFYKEHIEFLTEHAVDPDKRRYAVDGEAQRHYIDIDHYVAEEKIRLTLCRINGKMPLKNSPKIPFKHTESCHGTLK